MPENAQFMPRKDLLSPGEIETISSYLVARGINEVRLTGGEPTMRREFDDIVGRLAKLDIKKFGLTSNGLILKKKLPLLLDSNCKHLNISMDSLNPEKFHKIVRRRGFNEVFDAIVEAKERGFNVKLNVVMIRGVNDDEILDFVKFSGDYDIEVRFLELMRIGQVSAKENHKYISADEILGRIKENYGIQSANVAYDSTSFVYDISNGGRVGFIASESKPFCGSCSRWRLTADGHLRACLMSENGVDLRGVPLALYPKLLDQVLAMKPTGRIESVPQNMNEIGG
jgi:cyclic pyranopterin phosphate synthase